MLSCVWQVVVIDCDLYVTLVVVPLTERARDCVCACHCARAAIVSAMHVTLTEYTHYHLELRAVAICIL